MNKSNCKKYIRNAYRQLVANNKEITPENIEKEMIKVITKESKEYIAYAKIAVDNMKNSANTIITLNDLLGKIDFLPKIYTEYAAIEKAEKL